MTGKDAVGALPANGQAGPVQMPHGDLEDGFLRAMVYGQAHINFRDLDIAHDAKAGNVQ